MHIAKKSIQVSVPFQKEIFKFYPDRIKNIQISLQ